MWLSACKSGRGATLGQDAAVRPYCHRRGATIACAQVCVVCLQLVRTRLEDAGPDVRMVESLAPMWEEERARCGGTGPPSPPPDPLRDPQPLCPAVDATRAQFQVRSFCEHFMHLIRMMISLTAVATGSFCSIKKYLARDAQ